MASTADKNPQHHTQNMKKRLQETVDHLRQDIGKVITMYRPHAAREDTDLFPLLRSLVSANDTMRWPRISRKMNTSFSAPTASRR
jgi:glutaredoxin 2